MEGKKPRDTVEIDIGWDKVLLHFSYIFLQ